MRSNTNAIGIHNNSNKSIWDSVLSFTIEKMDQKLFQEQVHLKTYLFDTLCQFQSTFSMWYKDHALELETRLIRVIDDKSKRHMPLTDVDFKLLQTWWNGNFPTAVIIEELDVFDDQRARYTFRKQEDAKEWHLHSAMKKQTVQQCDLYDVNRSGLTGFRLNLKTETPLDITKEEVQSSAYDALHDEKSMKRHKHRQTAFMAEDKRFMYTLTLVKHPDSPVTQIEVEIELCHQDMDDDAINDKGISLQLGLQLLLRSIEILQVIDPLRSSQSYQSLLSVPITARS
jgi:hypothetical protein